MQYQKRDWEIVDYQGYILKNTNEIDVRGPEPKNLENNQYFVCIGAAQTFGCFSQKPYPSLLQERLNFQVLNLGFAGAGALLFLQEEKLLEYINKARFAVVQVMSGRSENNSVFYSGGRATLTRLSDGVKLQADDAYQKLLEANETSYVKKIIAETRQNWINNYKKLLQAIKVPKILFWFSTRETYYQEKYTNSYKLLGRFPHLVNLNMLNQIKKYSDEYVECISGRGMPHLLISRFNNKPTMVDGLHGKRQMFDNYYPSPEMHIEAATALEKVCKKYQFLNQA